VVSRHTAEARGEERKGRRGKREIRPGGRKARGRSGEEKESGGECGRRERGGEEE